MTDPHEQVAETRVARFRVSMSLLQELLHLPPTSTIVAVERCDAWADQGSFWVKVMSPDLPMAPVADVPEIFPTVTHERYRWDWNVQPSCTNEATS